MKLRLLTTAVVLAVMGFAIPVKAQNPETSTPETPSVQTQPNTDQVLQACAKDQADTLPNPYRDIPANHWALKAVLSMYYCGAYRGSIPPERAKSVLEQLNPQLSNPNPQS